jgi:hypothetical protein
LEPAKPVVPAPTVATPRAEPARAAGRCASSATEWSFSRTGRPCCIG